MAIELQSLRLLVLLIEHRDRVVSRDDLVEAIWHGRIVSDWAISGAIKGLRVALDDVRPQRQFIHTVNTGGYQFTADVQVDRHVAFEASAPTILVRIFRTHGEDADLACMAEGLAEDLIIALSRSKVWRVLSYNTSRALTDLDASPSREETTIIDGSVRKVGDRFCINIAIFDGMAGR